MQSKQLLCWSDMTDTEQSATSGSNEVVAANDTPLQFCAQVLMLGEMSLR